MLAELGGCSGVLLTGVLPLADGRAAQGAIRDSRAQTARWREGEVFGTKRSGPPHATAAVDLEQRTGLAVSRAKVTMNDERGQNVYHALGSLLTPYLFPTHDLHGPLPYQPPSPTDRLICDARLLCVPPLSRLCCCCSSHH